MKGNVATIELEIPVTTDPGETELAEMLVPEGEAIEPSADAGIATRPTDERGNTLATQTTDLREVASEQGWVLEGPSARRFFRRDLPRAIVTAYRHIPPEVRGRGITGSTSHLALGALAAGRGWKDGFWPYALPAGVKSMLNIATPTVGEGWEGALDWSR